MRERELLRMLRDRPNTDCGSFIGVLLTEHGNAMREFLHKLKDAQVITAGPLEGIYSSFEITEINGTNTQHQGDVYAFLLDKGEAAQLGIPLINTKPRYHGHRVS